MITHSTFSHSHENARKFTPKHRYIGYTHMLKLVSSLHYTNCSNIHAVTCACSPFHLHRDTNIYTLLQSRIHLCTHLVDKQEHACIFICTQMHLHSPRRQPLTHRRYTHMPTVHSHKYNNMLTISHKYSTHYSLK